MKRTPTPTAGEARRPRPKQAELFAAHDALARHHRVNLIARRLIRILAAESVDVANAALALARRAEEPAAAKIEPFGDGPGD
jgi:hypothetical protein